MITKEEFETKETSFYVELQHLEPIYMLIIDHWLKKNSTTWFFRHEDSNITWLGDLGNTENFIKYIESKPFEKRYGSIS
jgi:hypothetical protein